jgi:hypothetical protein
LRKLQNPSGRGHFGSFPAPKKEESAFFFFRAEAGAKIFSFREFSVAPFSTWAVVAFFIIMKRQTNRTRLSVVPDLSNVQILEKIGEGKFLND